MSDHTAENDAPMAQAAPECQHYWAWVSPAGTSRSARICHFCHQPDPKWLSHTAEVDLDHGDGCVDCEFADSHVIQAEAWESGYLACLDGEGQQDNPYRVLPPVTGGAA